MTAQLAPVSVSRFFDNNGFPLFLGKLTTYAAGTTTPLATYVDSTQTTQNTNPIILNLRGECQLWLDPTKAYKFLLQDALGNTIPGWPVDNITIGNANPSYSVIPTVDNLYTLGNASFAWANVYVGPNHAPILGASGNVGYYKRTQAEINLSVTPTDFSYPADPYVDPRRYGAKGDWNGSTGTDDTAAWQTTLNVAYASHGVAFFPPNFVSLVGALSLTMTAVTSIRIEGSSPTNSLFHAKAGLSSTSLLTFQITGGIQAQGECYITLRNFGIDSAAVVSGVHALSLFGVAQWQVSNVRIAQFDRGIDGQGCLVGLVDQNTEITLCNTAIRIALPAGAIVPLPTTNLIRVENTRLTLNHNIGLDYNGGTELQLKSVDFSGNGQAGNTATGGLFIRGQLSPDAFSATVSLYSCYFEGNGGISINADAQTGGATTIYSIQGGQILAADSGRSIVIAGCTKLSITDLDCGGPSDTWNLTASDCFLKNVIVHTLTDTNVTFPTYINVTTSLGNQREGRVTTFTATLTNATGTPTGTVTAIQQGAAYRLIFPQITGASTATSDPSFSGLPSNLIPAASRAFGGMRAFDNSAELYATMVVASGTGTITLSKPSATFTAAGNKGILTQSTNWIDL